ncbi:ABC transporter ATP-binding protein [Pseudovibrio ascidiaceicola]|uniref:ABC transporter ATP-binding protein n=1 Tax=Pseudovibrio ascidiaceicola TaxID=285279 RepID=UPI000D694A4C|nr:ABC transporter ATP-binding protein [Pseudovibrio ascidiaceicola]
MGKISISELSYAYQMGGNTLPILREASLALSSGAFATISGPSGSGKSTLLNLIGALDRPQHGDITVGDVELSKLSDRQLAGFRNRMIGFVFQSFHLLPVLSAAENVAWPLYFQGVPRSKRMERAREKLELVGLKDHLNKVPGKLSGGQRQRVAIARALVTEPSVVLADEPTANLDRKTAEEIVVLLRSLNENAGVTFLLATHDPLVVAHAVQRIELVDGKLIEREQVQTQEVLAHA